MIGGKKLELTPLKVKKRELIGKSAARKIRREQQIPGILYGDGFDPTPLTVELDDFKSVIHTEAGLNVILNLKVEGEKKEQTAIIKELQKDPIKDNFLHVDFMKISMDKEIEATVPLVLSGESVGVNEGGVLQQILWEIEVIALPLNIPDHIEVDVSDLDIGDALRVEDLILPEELEIRSREDEIIVSIVPPTELKEEELVVEEEEELEPELVGEEVAEGEVAAEKPEEEVKEEKAEQETVQEELKPREKK